MEMAKNLLRDMGKRIAHSLQTGGFGRQERGQSQEAFMANPLSTSRGRGLAQLDEGSEKIVYNFLSIFIEMQDKVVLQAFEIPRHPGSSGQWKRQLSVLICYQ
jgi:hypothetical protein